MDISLRLASSTNVETHELPDFSGFTISPVFCDAGAIEFSYPVDGVNFDQIKDLDEFRVRVYLNGLYRPELDAWIKDVDGDDLAEGTVWKFTGWLANGRFQEAVVYPENWPTYDANNPGQIYTDNTPGYFFRKLIINEAQQRGALAGMFLDNIVAANTTDGQPWQRLISVELKPGVDYLEVFSDLYDDEVCEWEVVGNQIKAYNFGTYGTDRTLGSNPLTFRAGRDLTDAPRKKSSRERVNAILAEGAEGVYVERKDTPEINARRRVEGTYNNSEIKWQSTLDAYAAVELARAKFPAVEVTVGLTFADSATPVPLVDFTVGDWAYCDTRNGLERLRIKQWVITQEADGTYAGSVTMGHAFQGRVTRLRKQFKKLIRGKARSGTSKKTAEIPTGAADNMPPAAPTNVTGFGTPYIDNNQYFAKITASWAQVTTNQDGSILTDLERYIVSYRQPTISTGWSPGMDAGVQTTLTWFPTAPNQATEVRVAAVDRWGNVSAWSSPVASFTTPGDTDPPPVPTVPIVDSYLGLLRIRWDGAFAAAAVQPYDFNAVEVHVSTTTGFTPSSATLSDTLRAPGYSLVKGTYGTTYYVKFVAVDELGNKSAATAQVTGTVAKVAEGDVASVNVGSLTAGTMSALVTLSGRIATALTGARTEMNSAGFYRFDASGNTLVAIDSTGNLLTGTFRTALTGRRIELTTGGSSGEATFYAPDGKRGFVRGYTQATGQEAIQFGMSIATGVVANNLWNRITYNSSAAGEYATYRSGTHEFVYDVSAGTNNGRFVVFGTEERGETVTRIRMQIDDGGCNIWYPIAGTFSVWDRSDSSGVNRLRLQTNSDSTRLYHISGGDTTFYELQNGTNYGRFQIGDAEFWWKWPTSTNTYKHWFAFTRNEDTTGNGGPLFKQLNAFGYGVTQEWRSTSTGGNGRLEFKDGGNSTYIVLHASAFTVVSRRASKRTLTPAPALSGLLKNLAVQQYMREDQHDGELSVLGLIAEDAPDEIRVDDENGVPQGIDLYSFASALLKYSQELDGRLAVLEGRGPRA